MTRKTIGSLLVCAAIGIRPVSQAQVARARDSKGSVPAATVHADGDQGMAGETPLNTAGVPDPKDVSVEESPLGLARSGVHIKAETPLKVRLSASLSSGVQRNEDTVAGVLMEAVTASSGKVLPQGTPVKVTILTAAKAGQVSSAGELSLEVLEVGSVPVVSNVLEFDGQEGRREVADANPEKGTEATVPTGASLQFFVMGSGDVTGSGGRVKSAGASGMGAGGASVSPGQATVGAPNSFARPAVGSTPTTAIHGTTPPH